MTHLLVNFVPLLGLVPSWPLYEVILNYLFLSVYVLTSSFSPHRFEHPTASQSSKKKKKRKEEEEEEEEENGGVIHWSRAFSYISWKKGPLRESFGASIPCDIAVLPLKTRPCVLNPS